ncbi:response regulator transcription factor [Rheinheimera sp. SA_1]|uniref:response regulator transcription factor n=1 Tax=Rheinheimera sp. SA_1 TaxID=1827365 RepID=UPI000A976722|nr:response regulator transcription factor [Rheinheimera sp. SA_1]
MHILLIEDQTALAANVMDYLTAQGHALDYADNGIRGLQLALTHNYDLLILDLSLPGLDGLQLCQQLRERASRYIPVLMLTARDSLDDKLLGFGCGADDYLTKPFALAELAVRVQALSRRHLLATDHVLAIGELTFDRQRQLVSRAGQLLELHPIGMKILQLLAEAYPAVLSRSELTSKLWGDNPPDSDALRAHIYLLRQQLDKPFVFNMLQTVHGVGFKLMTGENDG